MAGSRATVYGTWHSKIRKFLLQPVLWPERSRKTRTSIDPNRSGENAQAYYRWRSIELHAVAVTDTSYNSYNRSLAAHEKHKPNMCFESRASIKSTVSFFPRDNETVNETT